MAQPIPPDQYDIVVALIRSFREGVGTAELRRHLHPKPDTSEMVRCLQALARQRRIEVIAGTAGAPNARYRAIPEPAQPLDQPAPHTPPTNTGGDTARAAKPGPASAPPAVSSPAQPPATTAADPVSPPAHPPAGNRVAPVPADANATPASRPPDHSPAHAAAAAAGPTAGAWPAFDDVVREVVRDVVLSLSPQPSAVALAQTQAAILHWNATLTAALLVRVEQELRRVTPETASPAPPKPSDREIRSFRASSGGVGVGE